MSTLEEFRVSKRPVRLSVRTPGFHPGKKGSIPLRATIFEILKLDYRWPVRLSVRTPGFHPGKKGSIPLRATKLVVNKFYKINS